LVLADRSARVMGPGMKADKDRQLWGRGLAVLFSQQISRARYHGWELSVFPLNLLTRNKNKTDTKENEFVGLAVFFSQFSKEGRRTNHELRRPCERHRARP
jgi:hypothetical protein